MTNNDLHDDIDQLAVEIERKIEENREFLDDLPEFAPRSDRSRKLQRKVGKKS
jgi:hypothetical protein